MAIVTRKPEHEGYADLGGPNEPGEDFVVLVDDVPVGGTYWCGGGDVPDGQRWTSWGPAGHSPGHHSREDAEAVQVAAYLVRRGETQTFRLLVSLYGGGPDYVVTVEAATWAHARELGHTTWPDAKGLRVLDDDDRVDGAESVSPEGLTAAIERRAAEARQAGARRRGERGRRDARYRRAEERAGIRYSEDGGRYGTPRTRADDPRFDKSDLPPDMFAPNGEAVLALLERVTWWTWDDAVHVIAAAKQTPPRDWWEASGMRHRIWEAVRAAGEVRLAEAKALEVGLHDAKLMLAPLEAARRSGEYSPGTADWDHAFGLAQETALVFLVADRPELPDDVYDALTAVWRTGFPEDPTPARTRAGDQ